MSKEQTYTQHLAEYTQEAQQTAATVLSTEPAEPTLSTLDVARLACLVLKTLPSHLKSKQTIHTQTDLPGLLTQDPPSLRSMLWLALIEKEIRTHAQETSLREKETSQATDAALHFSLYRSWLNGMDDVIDSVPKPVTKKDLANNADFQTVTGALAQYLLREYHSQPEKKSPIRSSVREYRLLRDFWLEAINNHEVDEGHHTMSLTEAVSYNALTMPVITSSLIPATLDGETVDDQTRQELTHAIALYAIAGKMMDDLTDWVKDFSKNEANMFTAALTDSGELEQFAAKTATIRKLGQKAFVPLTLMKKWAPTAYAAYFNEVDRFMAALEKTLFTHLSMSLKGARQLLWAYALNEGLPQVSKNETS